MSVGIDKLVETFMGNPGPLEAKVKQDQQGLKPGELPEDFEEALALQQIQELQQSAQNQQAMQAGGAQPSIVEKLKQQLAAQQRMQAQPPQGQPPQFQPPQGQPQMAQGPQGGLPMPQGPQGGPPPAQQGQPVMAAHGGSIDQLISNLGRHYAGGGIVAFNGEEDSDVKDEEIKKKLQQYTLQQQGADWVARKQAARIAEAEDEIRRQALLSQIPTGGQRAPASTGDMPGEAERNISNAMAAMPGASAAKGFAGGIRGLLTALSGMNSGNGEREAAPKAAAEAAYTDPEVEKLKRLAAARAQTGRNTNPDAVPRKQITGTSPDDAKPRPSAANISAAAETQAIDPNSLRALLEAKIRKDLGKDEEAEWAKGSRRYEDFVGLDKLLQPREARIAEREAMLKKIQGERTPTWVEALSAAGRPVRGGLGTLLNQMGSAAESTRKGYSAEDLKFFDDIGAMRDEVAKLRLEGKYKAAAAGEAAIKDAIAGQRQAESSATSLLNTDEQTATRRQIAKDAALARVEAAKARASGSGSGDKQQLNELKALQSSLKDQIKTVFNKADRQKIQTQLDQVNAEIAKMAGLSTMASAPGAASPGGTRPPLSSFQR